MSTPEQQQIACAIIKTAWEMKQQHLDTEAQAAENARVDVENAGRRAAIRVEAKKLPTFRERGDVDAAFEAGQHAMLTFSKGTGRKMGEDGKVVPGSEFEIGNADLNDAEKIAALAELSAAVPADKQHLLHKLVG
jgi:hypothetical protein